MMSDNSILFLHCFNVALHTFDDDREFHNAFFALSVALVPNCVISLSC